MSPTSPFDQFEPLLRDPSPQLENTTFRCSSYIYYSVSSIVELVVFKFIIGTKVVHQPQFSQASPPLNQITGDSFTIQRTKRTTFLIQKLDIRITMPEKEEAVFRKLTSMDMAGFGCTMRLLLTRIYRFCGNVFGSVIRSYGSFESDSI